MLGNDLSQHIDAPLAIFSYGQGENLMAAGYSIPYVDGEPVRYSLYQYINEEAKRLSDKGIYVGSGGIEANGSCNAMLTPNGSFKFIDVRIHDKINFNHLTKP